MAFILEGLLRTPRYLTESTLRVGLLTVTYQYGKDAIRVMAPCGGVSAATAIRNAAPLFRIIGEEGIAAGSIANEKLCSNRQPEEHYQKGEDLYAASFGGALGS